MKHRFTPTVRRDISRAEEWWQENRPEAPDALVAEIDAALDQLEAQPRSTAVYAAWNRDAVHRIFLPKTQKFLYYLVRDDVVVLLRLVGAAQEEQPRFDKTSLS